MEIEKITSIKIGDIIEWTGDNPDKFAVTNVFPGNQPIYGGYEYRDWSFRVKSLSDGHTELIDGCTMENIHFLKK